MLKRQKFPNKFLSKSLFKPNYATFAQILEKVTINIEEDEGLKLQDEGPNIINEKQDLFQANFKIESPPENLINVSIKYIYLVQ